MDKRFWGFLAAVAVILAGIYIITNDDKAGAPATGKANLTNHIRGGGPDAITLVEYGDFACPACAQYYPIVKTVIGRYSDQVAFQFRNFPLFQIPGHENSIAAARAAEAADKQDKYWEMHDLLYENQQSWIPSKEPLEVFTGYADQLGLDTKQFQEDYKSREVNNRVQADLKEGNRLGVTGTPTFFIDGKKISNPDASVEAFSKVIEAAIKQKTGKDPVPTSGEVTPETSEVSPVETSPGTPAQQ